MKRRRVKITGIGPVTPAGIGRDKFWAGLLSGASYVAPFTDLSPTLGNLSAAKIESFKIEDYAETHLVPKGAARQSLFGVAGAVLALADAVVSVEELRSRDAVVVTGCSIMDFGTIGRSMDSTLTKGPRSAVARTIFSSGIGSVASSIKDSLGLSSRTISISNQCTSGLEAVLTAVRAIENGEAELALCGGVDAPLNRFPIVELQAAGMTSSSIDVTSRQVRPFDLWRTTSVLAEGGAMFVLEPEESRRRGYCYINGGSANDMLGLYSGLVLAARQALANANIPAESVDAIHAWGTGDRVLDRAEAEALSQLFGCGLTDIAAYSIKGTVGLALGGASAIQLAASCLSARMGIIPPTVNWEFPDPACPLNLSRTARTIDIRTTMVCSHGVGGVNAAVILERC